METECVSETSEILKELTRTTFPEDGDGVCLWNVGDFWTIDTAISLRKFTQFCRGESLKKYKNYFAPVGV
jgi:hypothetical protein